MYIERQKNKTHVYTRYTPPFVTSKFSSATVDPCRPTSSVSVPTYGFFTANVDFFLS